MNKTRQIIEKALRRGTVAISFLYNGKARNAMLGCGCITEGNPVFGKQINRAIRLHNGREYLVLKTNNEDTADGHAIKTFALDKISALSLA